MQEKIILKTTSEVNAKGSLVFLLLGLSLVLYTILIGIFKLSILITIGCIVFILLLLIMVLLQLGKVYLVYENKLSIQSLWAYNKRTKAKPFSIPISTIERVEIIDSSDNYLYYPAFNHIRIFHKTAKKGDFTKFTVEKDANFEALVRFIHLLEQNEVKYLIKTRVKELQNVLRAKEIEYKPLS